MTGDDRIVGKSGMTVAQAKAMFSTEHYSPIRAKAEQAYLVEALARATAAHPPPPTRPVVERRRTYGPHDPNTAPQTVTVWGDGQWPREEEAPIPAELTRQREQLNTHAAQPIGCHPQGDSEQPPINPENAVPS